MMIEASISVPDESVITATISITAAEWRAMRDQVRSINQPTVALAEFALKLDGFISAVNI